MREIKFRAWDKGEKKMYYNIQNSYDFTGDVEPEDCSDYFGDILKEENFIVMQFTSIKDKNGKDIYEGDILKIKPNPEDTEIVEVIFHKGCFCYKTKEGGIFAFYSSEDYMCITENKEVIGNIYENPELSKR